MERLPVRGYRNRSARGARTLLIAFIAVCAGLGGGQGGSAVLAACRPTFVLVFVPMAWHGSLGAFDAAADAATKIFVASSDIERYADVRVSKIHKVMPADLSNSSLDVEVVAFGAKQSPGDRYIGLTDGDLVLNGDPNVTGWTTMYGQGLVAEASDAIIVSHELGHTFGLCDEYNFLAWRNGASARGPCPNGYPTSCPRDPRAICAGEPLPGGGYCIMGPSGLPNPRGFDAACRSALETAFSRLFAQACTPPPATPTPPAAPPAPSPTPPAPPPTHLGRVAFETDSSGHFEVYLAEADGSGITRLTYSAGNAYQPSWSPNGEELVFTASDRGHMQLYLVNVDGTARRQLLASDADDEMPAWSPDGQWIAFASDRGGRFGLYRVHPDGTGLAAVVQGTVDCYRPSWSPDSAYLAYYAGSGGGFDVFTTPAAGGTATQLTRGNGANLQPSWSPDGTNIAFASDRQGVLRLFVMRTDGSDQRAVQRSPNGAWHPVWLADGEWIAFQTVREGKLGVFLLNATSGELRRVSPSSFTSADPAAVRPVP
jgi:TolB protein